MQFFTLTALFALVAIASAYHHEDYHHHPSYKYEYGVKDPHTHDHKSAWEHRDGDHTKGGYTLDEADGTHRVVEYHSDGKGLHAVVKRIGHAHHPDHYGHEHGHGGYGHGHGSATSYANQNQHHH
ncbi:cuticle protein 19-like [Culicoides brevitarsis]|uniref:cuticle protein 19-like n=1 Tax=Culicoides brevitarsis TaxID=469753 RepID=UPI00307B88E4